MGDVSVSGVCDHQWCNYLLSEGYAKMLQAPPLAYFFLLFFYVSMYKLYSFMDLYLVF